MKEAVARIFQILFTALFFFVGLAVLPFAWILRDGLGPDSTRSYGWEAVVRTWGTFYVGPALVVLALLATVATVLCNARGGSP